MRVSTLVVRVLTLRPPHQHSQPPSANPDVTGRGWGGRPCPGGTGRRAENTGELIPLDVKVGDTVVYSKYGGTEITDGGEDLLILNGRDVLAVVK